MLACLLLGRLCTGTRASIVARLATLTTKARLLRTLANRLRSTLLVFTMLRLRQILSFTIRRRSRHSEDHPHCSLLAFGLYPANSRVVRLHLLKTTSNTFGLVSVFAFLAAEEKVILSTFRSQPRLLFVAMRAEQKGMDHSFRTFLCLHHTRKTSRCEPKCYIRAQLLQASTISYNSRQNKPNFVPFGESRGFCRIPYHCNPKHWK